MTIKQWIVNVTCDGDLTVADRVVAAYIGAACDSGVAHLSVKHITEHTGMGRRTVFYSIQRIASRGHFDVIKGGGRGNTNAYRLRLENGTAVAVAHPMSAKPHQGRNQNG